MNNLSSNELIGYVDLSDFYEIWLNDREILVHKSVSGLKNIRNIFPVTPLA